MPGRRILMIENEGAFRSALAEALAGAGVHVEIAVDGVDGLERLRAGPPPSAILLDLGLPRIGGEEFLRALRADPRYDEVPVVTMTADEARTGGSAAAAHVRKPVDLDDLLQILLSLSDAAAA